MSIYRRRKHDIPELNTASLPDLIFTILFFFMLVTHMRKTTVKVKYQVPQGTELTKLVKKSAISYIYIYRYTHQCYWRGFGQQYVCAAERQDC